MNEWCPVSLSATSPRPEQLMQHKRGPRSAAGASVCGESPDDPDVPRGGNYDEQHPVSRPTFATRDARWLPEERR